MLASMVRLRAYDLARVKYQEACKSFKIFAYALKILFISFEYRGVIHKYVR